MSRAKVRPEDEPEGLPSLLAEVDDRDLEDIVQSAARDLGAPIALVSLVLDHVQFFKAHVGLPADLEAARGTAREASFCQFVTSSGEAFTVEDTLKDDRVPKQLVDAYGLRAYLGFPVVVEGTVVGSLCVLDTKPRTFDETQRHALEHLSRVATQRLQELVDARRRGPGSIVDLAAAPAAAALVRSLQPVARRAGSMLAALRAVAAHVRLSRHVMDGGATPESTLATTLRSAEHALEEIEDGLFNLQADATDAEESARALRDVLDDRDAPRLETVVVAAQDLARTATEAVGGVLLPNFPDRQRIAAPMGLTIALLATGMTSLGASLLQAGEKGGIRVTLAPGAGNVVVSLQASVDDALLANLGERLASCAAGEASISIDRGAREIRYSFASIVEDPPR